MPAPDRLAFGDFVLERRQRRVLNLDGSALRLTPRQFDALALFVDSAGELLDKDTLMRALWPGLVVEENNISQVVSALRRAFGDDRQGNRFIQTVPRRGFRFIAPVRALPDPVSAADGGTEPAALALATGPAARTLAVLPFKPLQGSGRDELLEAGMADSLATRLSAVAGLVVRSTSSAMRYAGPDQDVRRAAHELDVAWIVDGSLQLRGDRLRVNSRLLRTADGTAAWSGTFDEQFTDVFAVQDQILDRVEQALLPVLQSHVVAAARPAPEGEYGATRNVDAYRLYLAATAQMRDQRADGLRESIRLFNGALNLDPGYALAWTALSDAHWRLAIVGETAPRTAFVVADAALRRALSLAPDLVPARASLASQLYMFDYDWPGAEREFRHAIKTNPNHHRAHFNLGQMLLTQDRIDEGFDHIRLARELDPLNPIVNALEASFLLVGGRAAEGRERLARSFELAPQLPLAHLVKAQWLFAERQPDACIASLRQAVAAGGGAAVYDGLLAFYLARTGRPDEARAIHDRLEQRARTDYVAATALAAARAGLGDAESALDALEQAYVQRDPRLVWLKDAPYWASLHNESRFAALMRKLRLDGFGSGLWNP